MDVEVWPQVVGDVFPQPCDDAPTGVDGGNTFATFNCFGNEWRNMVQRHEEGVVVCTVEEWRVYKAGADVCDVQGHFLGVSKLVDGLQVD